jgi:hypothetical protein
MRSLRRNPRSFRAGRMSTGLLESLAVRNRAQGGRFATILKSLRTASETTRTAMMNSNQRKNMLVCDARPSPRFSSLTPVETSHVQFPISSQRSPLDFLLA